MNRRAFLGVVGTAVFAGCGGQSDQTPVVSVGDMDELGATKRTCDPDVANQGRVTLDGRNVSVEGTIVGEAICAKPSGQVLSGTGTAEGVVNIVIEASVPGERDCEKCRTRIDYRGAVTLDEKPRTVTLEHVTLDGAQTEVARVVTVETGTEATPSQTEADSSPQTGTATRDR